MRRANADPKRESLSHFVHRTDSFSAPLNIPMAGSGPAPATVTMSRLGQFGRFGNQVFQYAFLRLYAARHGLLYQAPQWAGSALFGHDDPPITNPGFPKLFESEHHSILNSLSQPVVNVDLVEYFQYHTSHYAPQKAAFRDLFRPLDRWRAPLDDAIERLRDGGRTLVAIHLRRARRALADQWLTTSDDDLIVLFHGPMGKAQEAAVERAIFHITPDRQDLGYIRLARSALRRGLGSIWAIQHLLTAMLFLPAQRLPMPHDFNLIPSWLLPLYIKYLQGDEGV